MSSEHDSPLASSPVVEVQNSGSVEIGETQKVNGGGEMRSCSVLICQIPMQGFLPCRWREKWAALGNPRRG
ncbi:hypothetical protein Hanom_Chr02g00170931 [Helianthus anomalus]